MKYYFIEPRTSGTYNYMQFHYGHSESSDLSQNPEGWIVTDEDLNKIPGSYNIYEIPEIFQDNIKEFRTEFWDGEIILERIE